MPLPSDKMEEVPRLEQGPSSAEQVFESGSYEQISKPSTESSMEERPASIPQTALDHSASDPETEELRQIEKLMSRGLEESYLALSAEKRQAFRIRGEETASKIINMLEKGRISVKEIVTLLIQWLQMLPGLNRFFIEQEAKIRADEIMRLDEERRQSQ